MRRMAFFISIVAFDCHQNLHEACNCAGMDGTQAINDITGDGPFAR